MIQSFQMNNATVSDTEVSFAVSLYDSRVSGPEGSGDRAPRMDERHAGKEATFR